MKNEEMREMDEMYSLNILIESNREDEEPWRLNRIQRVIGYVQALADINKQDEFYKKIYSIYDFKGSLTVKWNVEPTQNEKDWLQKAWGSSITGHEPTEIDHEVSDNPKGQSTKARLFILPIKR